MTILSFATSLWRELEPIWVTGVACIGLEILLRKRGRHYVNKRAPGKKKL